MTSKCTCDSCKRWNEFIEHKATFTPSQLGFRNLREKTDYLNKYRAERDQECERKENR